MNDLAMQVEERQRLLRLERKVDYLFSNSASTQSNRLR